MVFFVLQYSQKEDKYEEEIKVLTDKLKEVNFHLRPPSGVQDRLFSLFSNINSTINLSP